jgi:hypothetical protein
LGGTRFDRPVSTPVLALNFTNFGWPVLRTLRTLALQPRSMLCLRKPNSVHAIATNHPRFDRSRTL